MVPSQIRKNGFDDIRVLVLVRNQQCAVYSTVYGKETHAGTETLAKLKIVMAMQHIANFLIASRLPFHYMTYETIVHETDLFRKLLTEWGLDGSKIPTPKNENEKWYNFVPKPAKP